MDEPRECLLSPPGVLQAVVSQSISCSQRGGPGAGGCRELRGTDLRAQHGCVPGSTTTSLLVSGGGEGGGLFTTRQPESRAAPKLIRG